MACVPLLSVAKVSIYKSSNEREERKKMKKIRKLINVALLLVDVCLLGACGKSASSEQDSDVNESFDGYNNENDSSDTVDFQMVWRGFSLQMKIIGSVLMKMGMCCLKKNTDGLMNLLEIIQ